MLVFNWYLKRFFDEHLGEGVSLGKKTINSILYVSI